jgi:hypothetical protein
MSNQQLANCGAAYRSLKWLNQIPLESQGYLEGDNARSAFTQYFNQNNPCLGVWINRGNVKDESKAVNEIRISYKGHKQGGKYTDLVKALQNQANGGSQVTAREYVNFMDGKIPGVCDLSPPVAMLAAITLVAEYGRGYTSAPKEVYDVAKAVENQQGDWNALADKVWTVKGEGEAYTGEDY